MKTKTLIYAALSILFVTLSAANSLAMSKNKINTALNKIESVISKKTTDNALIVDISTQTIYFVKDGKEIKNYPISSSKFGIGSTKNSNKTPLGVHRIENMIGEDAPLGTIFVARGNTGKKAKIITEPIDIKSDMVTSRIMWLKGLEDGVNSGNGIDSYKRYIYIHGTPEEGLIGKPASHGCIRMKNKDVIELFSKVTEKTPVIIVE